MKKMKSLVAGVLIVCMLVGCVPLSAAEELVFQSFALQDYADGAELDSSGWIYRITEDGYAEVLGHRDGSASSLSIPARLGGAEVAAIGEDAFAANTSLRSITIPAAVGEIADSAFASQSSLTVRGYNGSAALTFAGERGFAEDNRSEYDFFDSVLDLSEMQSAQWKRDGGTLNIKGQYADLIEKGAIVYLPDGMPVSVVSVSQEGDGITASVRDASFEETIESYKVENMELRPDWSTIELHEGVELVSSGITPKDVTVSEYFDYKNAVSFKIDEGGGHSLSGMANVDLRYVLSLEYEWFELKELSYNSDVSASASITQSFEKKGSTKPKEKPLFTVRLVGYGPVSMWVAVTLRYSLSGKATLSTSVSVHDRFSWSLDAAAKKNSTVDYKKPVMDITGTATVGIVPSARVILGFGYSKWALSVAEINPYLGLRAEYASDTLTPCHNVSAYADAQVDVRVGMLKGRQHSQIKEKVLYAGTLYQGNKLIAKKHLEYKTGKWQDECTYEEGYDVHLYLAPGVLWQTIKVKKGDVLPQMTPPEREGYIFTGWYWDAACTNPWTFDTQVLQNVSLYAGWEPEATPTPTETSIPTATPDPNPANTPDIEPGYTSTPEHTATPSPTPLPSEVSYILEEWGGKDKSDFYRISIDDWGDGEYHIGYHYHHGEPGFPCDGEIERVWLGEGEAFKAYYIEPDPFNAIGNMNITVPGVDMTCLVVDAAYSDELIITNIQYHGDVFYQDIRGNLPETAYVRGSSYLKLYDNATTRHLIVGSEVGCLDIHGVYNLESIELRGATRVIGVDWEKGYAISKSKAESKESNGMISVTGSAIPNGNGGTLVSLHEAAGDVIIPAQIGGMTITVLAADCIPAGVTAVEIPAGVAAIDENAFRMAEDLERITVAAGNAQYHAKDGVLYHQDGTLVCYPHAKTAESYTVPEGTTAIGPRAISGAENLKELTLPESLAVLHDRAIYDCPALERADFAADPQQIGAYVFENCPNLAVYGPLGYTYLEYICYEGGIGYNEYAVSFMSDGELLFAMPASAGLPIDYIPGPENSEKIIKGWSTTKDGKKLWNFDQDVMPARDLTLYAVWGYDFDYTVKNGKVTLTKYLAMGDNYYEVRVPETVDGKPVTAIAPDAFDGLSWYPTLVGNRGSVTEAFAAEHGFYFNPLRYTLKFEANGGRLYPLEQTLCATDVITLPETERDNYEFTGWFSDSACTKAFADGTAMPASDLTLYAGWKKIDESIADSLFTYESDEENYVTITGYLGTEKDVVIPAEINGWTVSSIGAFAFAGSDIESIALPDEISFIEEYAFSGCESLAHVEFMPVDSWFGGIVDIGMGAFSGCTALEEIELPDTLESIGSRAFAGSGLVSLEIPASVESLYVDIVRDCEKLVYLSVDDEHEWLSSEGGAIYRNGDLIIWPSGLEVDDDFVFDTGIGDYALSGIDCVTATVGWNIGYEAMSDCMNLRKVTFKEASIEERAFANCPVLTELEFLESEYSGQIDANAFVGSPIKTIRFNGAGDYWLADDAFPVSDDLIIYGPANSVVEQWALDHGVRFVSENTVLAEAISLGRESMALSVGRSAQFGVTFTPEDATETEIEWSSSAPHVATVYGDGIVIGLSEGSAVITATAVGGAQAQCVVSVKADEYPVKMVLPSALKVLEAEAFAGSGFAYVRCPLGMKSIGSRAFADCAALQVIEIPDSVESIADDAFAGSANVTIYAPLGSYAIEWAKKNGVSYLEE